MSKKKILILGASSDIGVELIKVLRSKKKWEIHAHCNSNLSRLKKMHLDRIIKNNFINAEKILKFTRKNRKYFRGFDAYVNLTGYLKPNLIKDLNVKNFYDHINANFLSGFFILREVIEGMKKRKSGGDVVLSSSIGTKFGGGSRTYAYSLSKHLNEFIPNEYRKLVKKNIYINVLQIGLTDTKLNLKLKKKKFQKRINLIPLSRMAKPSEVVAYINFFLNGNNKLISCEKINISGGE